MVKYLHEGPVFPRKAMTPQQRAAARAELEWIEQDLFWARERAAKWATYAAEVRDDPTVDPGLQQRTLDYAARYAALVVKGERYRSMVLADFADEPEHRPAYHAEH